MVHMLHNIIDCMHDSSIVSSIVGQNTVHTVCKANQLC